MQAVGLNLKRKQLRKKPLFKKILKFLGTIILIFGLYNFLADFFLVKTIKVVGSEGEILKGIKEIGGQNLLFLDTSRWEEQIERANPTFKDIKLQKKFPSQVLVTFEKREARAAIFHPHSKTFFLIDEEGIILKQEKEETKLPAIIASLQNFKIGDRIRNKSIDFALDIILTLKDRALGSKFELAESQQILKATLLENIVILANLEKDQEKTVYSLQILSEKFRIEGAWPKKIDLRFEKPVLIF